MAGLVMSPAIQARQLMLIPGITGDSQIENYVGWIIVDSVSAQVVEGECSEITVDKPLDGASLQLIAAASSGEIFNQIDIVDLRFFGEGELQEILSVRLSPVKIMSLSLSGGDDSFSESLVLDTGTLVFNPETPSVFTVPCGKLKK
jgi:type VI protein secretion system component Hcp